MTNRSSAWIAGFIWNIADDVLRDLYAFGECHPVIGNMTVVQRFNADPSAGTERLATEDSVGVLG